MVSRGKNTNYLHSTVTQLRGFKNKQFNVEYMFGIYVDK